MALLGALGVRAWTRARANATSARLHRWRFEAICGGASLALSVAIHGAGAVFPATQEWARSPVSVDLAPSRLWDWSDAQFLAVFRQEAGASR